MINVYLDNEFFQNCVITSDNELHNLKNAIELSYNCNERSSAEFTFIMMKGFDNDPTTSEGTYQYGIFVQDDRFYDVSIYTYKGVFNIDRQKHIPGWSIHTLIPSEATAMWKVYTLYR